MERQVVIRLSGNALDVSPDGKSILPQEIRGMLTPHLRYKHMQMLRGQDAYDYSGRRRPMREEWRRLYDFDKYGRMITGIGFQDRITKILQTRGYTVTVEDVSPKHPRRDRFTVDWDNVARNFTFKARQDECLSNIVAAPRGIVEAPTGFGKSFTFRAIGLTFPKANIAITARRKDIVESIRGNLTAVLPNIGQIGGGVNKPGRITVCTADSLHRLNKDDIDILLGEEAHELAADSYAKELTQFKYARMYGFSASPTGRMDNADIRLESIFGPVIFSMSYPEAVTYGLVVPIRVRWVEVICENPCAGMQDVKRKRWGIWRNARRNQVLADVAKEFGDDEQVLIMVTTFEHAVYLRQQLPDFTLCYAERDDKDFKEYIEQGLLPPDEPLMTSARRQELRERFARGDLKKVIATDVWSTGVSFNGLSVLIRADARSSEIMDTQIPGRVCRLNPETGKDEGLLIDCIDRFDPGFWAASRKRQKNYEAKGWTQDLPRYGRPGLM